LKQAYVLHRATGRAMGDRQGCAQCL
jgi:hypothetical protein